MTEASRRRAGADGRPVQFIAGILTQQVELTGERLQIGIVTHARFIRDTIALLDNPRALDRRPPAAPSGPIPGAVAASALEMGEDQ